MYVTRIREIIAALFALLLVVALAIGAALAMGKRVPIVSDLLGR